MGESRERQSKRKVVERQKSVKIAQESTCSIDKSNYKLEIQDSPEHIWGISEGHD